MKPPKQANITDDGYDITTGKAVGIRYGFIRVWHTGMEIKLGQQCYVRPMFNMPKFKLNINTDMVRAVLILAGWLFVLIFILWMRHK